MEDLFLIFSESLPAATLLMLLALFVSRAKSTAVRRHQVLFWCLLLTCLYPLLQNHLPKWRILPRIQPPTFVSSERPSATASAAESPAQPHSGSFPWFTVFAVTWLGGAMFMLARIGMGIAHLTWKQRETLPVDCPRMLGIFNCAQSKVRLGRRPTFEIHPDYPMPMTWGWQQPHIWLPLEAEDWTDEELKCVLIHELAHIERNDFVAEILSRTALALYWFHPLAWMIDRRLELTREMACDDHVLLAGQSANGYAASLGSIAAGLTMPMNLPETAAGFFGKKPLIARVIGIADPWRTRGRLTAEESFAGAAPALVVTVMMASLGVKAAAEIRQEQLPQRAAIPSPPVISIWEDLVQPVSDALIERPAVSSLQQPALRFRNEPNRIATAPPTTPTPEQNKARPAFGIALAALPEQILPRRAFVASSTEDELFPLPIIAATAGGVAARQRLASAPSGISPGLITTAGNSSRGPKGLTGSTGPTVGKESALTTDPTKGRATTSKVAGTGNEPRKLAAYMESGKSGRKNLAFDFVVDKTIPTKSLIPEVSTDLRTWRPLDLAEPAIVRRAADKATDRLTYRMPPNKGKVSYGFIRIRRAKTTVPPTGRPLLGKDGLIQSPTASSKSVGTDSKGNLTGSSIGRKSPVSALKSP
jgi:beta-lactamase regulating signal transducer with metallopeptidase domain